MPKPVWLQCGREGWRRFSEPIEVLRADSLPGVLATLAEVEEATRRGLWAAGFLSYEAATAFDAALAARAPGLLPFAWFGLYERCDRAELPRPEPAGGSPPSRWRPSLDRDRYRAMVARIRDHIAAGDTYQVNFTWRLDAEFRADPWPFFVELAARDRTRYAAYVDTGEHAICSFSPELFFRLDGSRLACRPMKGTSPRGLYRADDDRRRSRLRASVKNRAENVMIVDMVRNDLGRIARPGSVRTSSLFDLETYATVLQMTSTVTARTDATWLEILTALFPCASVTGAPKVETMKIIAELEERPRGVYTGAIGFAGPSRKSLFNVAIRTVQIDRSAGRAEYGTGGGIVWDSEPDEEYSEGLTKALVIAPREADFSLLETLRWGDGGFDLLDRHLDRLEDSADLLGFDCDRARVRARLDELSRDLAHRAAPVGDSGAPHRGFRVRVLLSRDGRLRLEHREFEPKASLWTIAVARGPIDPADRFYYHKTTARRAYEAFRREAPQADDVLLWNPSGELTETTTANIALELRGRWFTPPVACGLLAGTQRAELLARGRLAERVLTLEDLDRADSLAALNSVRGWIPARLAKARAPSLLPATPG